MRKSIFAGLTATAVAVSLALAGCSGGDSKQSTDDQSGDQSGGAAADKGSVEGELTVWVDETREPAVSAAAEQYTEETGVKVNLVQKNFDDIRADFTAQVPTGKGPDITVGAHDWLGELTANGVVAPVELGDKAHDFDPKAISAFTYDGQLYGLPYAVENIALIRNVALAPEAPATWDEMMAASEAAGTKYKFLIQMDGEKGDPYTFYPFQTSFGSTVFKQNDDGSYTNELNLATGGDEFAKFLADNGPKGTDAFNQDRSYDIAVDAFAKGDSPFIVGGPWMLEKFDDIELSIDPIPSAGGQPAKPFAGVQGFYLSAKSENALLASDFITNYLSTEAAQVAMYEAGGRPPALKSAAEVAAKDPITAGFIAAGEDALPMPSIPEMGAVWTPWGRTEAQIIAGEVEPAAGWAKMISDIEAAIAG